MLTNIYYALPGQYGILAEGQSVIEKAEPRKDDTPLPSEKLNGAEAGMTSWRAYLGCPKASRRKNGLRFCKESPLEVKSSSSYCVHF